MARFSRLDNNRVNYPTHYMMVRNFDKRTIDWVMVDGELTEEDINKINAYKGDYRVLIFKNTNGQNSELIKMINNPYIKLSVMGGLNYLNKKKFNQHSYIDRTIYTPNNLSQIISIFEQIERQIRPTWTDTQKCMFVYTKLIKVMHYQYNNESDYENGVDVARTLNSLIAKRSVCAGFALIFKESMDRLGIECVYQNRDHHHSWNVVKLEGKWRAFDLTWDVTGKSFQYFGLQDDQEFYSNPHHDLNAATEEVRYKCSAFSPDELKEAMKVIKFKGLKIEREAKYTGRYYMHTVNNIAIATDNQRMVAVQVMPNETKEQVQRKLDYSFANPGLPINSNIFNIFHRRDNSSFVIIKTGKQKKQANEYALVDFSNENGKFKVNISLILSENDLIHCTDPRVNYAIANNLLSKHRLERKMQHFNGYVGYIGQNTSLLYDSRFEHDELNIQHRH